MATMIRQTVGAEKKSFGKTMAYIIGIVAAVNLLIELTNLLPQQYALASTIIAIMACAIVCRHIINRKIARYTYVLMENELIIYKEIGKSEKKILNIKLGDIEDIEPVNKKQRKKNCKKLYRLSCRLRGRDVYMLRYKENDKIFGFIFQPNDDLYAELIKGIKI